MSDIKSLYIHIPFCSEICSYCDFVKVYKNDSIIDRYLDRLKDEINSIPVRVLKTIYIGGGTPSCLSEKQLEKLLEMVAVFEVEKDGEFTIEANTESLSEEKIKLLSKCGVNRVSLGIQTFDEKLLKLLNRRHTKNDVFTVVENLNKYGIENYSFDFIYSLPFQTKEDLEKDLNIAFSLNPKHLSFYSLLVEEHTMLYIKGYREAEDSTQREMYDFIYSRLKENGYYRYEISNFSKPGYQSRHNKVYWKDEKYYAAGVSASGYIDNYRYTNTKSLDKYINGDNNKDIEYIDKEDNIVEYIMLGFRLDEGLSLSDFKSKFDVDFMCEYKDVISRLIDAKLIEIKDDRVLATYDGSLVLHRIIEEFM